MTLVNRLKALERFRARQDAELNADIDRELDRLQVPAEGRDELAARLLPWVRGLRTLTDQKLLDFLHGKTGLPWE